MRNTEEKQVVKLLGEGPRKPNVSNISIMFFQIVQFCQLANDILYLFLCFSALFAEIGYLLYITKSSEIGIE